MKSFYIVLLAVVALLTGCDSVGSDERLIEIPSNIELAFIPPYTPEMNPIEQVWKEIRKRGFKNKAFQTLEALFLKPRFRISFQTCSIGFISGV